MLMALLPLSGWALEEPVMVSLPNLATGLIYNGSQQTLLTGTAVFPADYDLSYENGGIVYAVNDGTAAPGAEEGTKAFPKAKNAGVWTVWYKVLGDGTTYATTDWKKVGTGVTPTGRVRISKATPVITRPQAETGLKYTADEQGLLRGAGSAAITDDTEDVLTLLYSIDGGGTWKEYTDADFDETFVGLNADDYTIKLKVAADAVNENWIEATDEFDVTIGPKSLDDADVQITLRDGFENPVYTKEAKTLELTDIVVTWKKSGGDVVLANTGVDYAIADYLVGGNASNINAGPATCNLTSGTTPNFIGGKVNFTIEKRSITDAKITVTSPDVVYKGATLNADDLAAAGWKVNDALTAINADLTLDTDYTLTTSAKNVTTGKKSSVVVEGTGNYKDSKTVKFDVTKATLYVDAKPYTTGRGTAVTNDDLVNGNYYEFRGWLGDDATAETKPTVTGTPTMGLKDLQTTDNAGHFDGGIEVKTVGNLKADNYEFAVGNAAMLNVDASVLTIQFKSDLAYYYKDVVPDFATYTNFVDISTPAAVTAMTIKMYDGETALNTGDALTVGKTYTLKVTDKTITSNFVLEEEIADKVITVQRYPLTVIAKDQSIAYGDGMHITNATADTYVIIKDGVTNTQYTKAAFNTKFGIAEYKPYFIDNLEWIGDKTISSPGQVKVNLKETYDDELFDVTTENGAVSFNNVSTDLVLDRVAIPNAAAVDDAANTAAAKIEEYDQAEGINVTFTFPGHTMKANTWYSWVLPFNTSVKEISEAFGYAVVDILNENGASKKSDVKFSLHMGDIAAGQPFILKVYQEIKPEEFEAGAVKFNGVKIINGSTIDTDANECQFIGTYTGKYGLNGDGTEYLFRLGEQSYSKGGADSSIRPLGAYIKFAEASEAHYMYIEEPDGSTTAISSIASDGEMIPAQGWYTVNGVKLETAPTEKGIYINNGKKIVIK